MKHKQYALAIHGGAGTILKAKMTPEKEVAYRHALQNALVAGESILEKGGTALNAVEKAVQILEDSPLFNAGRGAVFTNDGKQEMDASIMCGKSLKAGAVAALQQVRYPVSLAKKILESSEFVFLSGAGAHLFAKKMNLEIRPDAWFYDAYRYEQWQKAKNANQIQLDHTEQTDEKHGTVGAVALDLNGDLAAATSTGGLTNKKYGRIGDSPIIGIGTYANNQTCAVSCTGYGEYFIRGVVAYDVSCLMEYRGWGLEQAAHYVIHKKQAALGGDGGLIAIDKMGNISMPFNSEGMYRGLVKKGTSPQIDIFKT